MTIYKIAHFYSTNHDETSFFIQSDIDVPTLVEILASLQFRFEEVDETTCIDDKHVLKLLIKYFGAEDVTEEYQTYLPYTHLNTDEWDVVNSFAVNDSIIVQIDQYGARESCCGSTYKEIMDKHLPKTEEFEKDIADLTFYPELRSK